jgi:WD40 repeat protein
MLCKFKGLINKSMQIKATFSEDGRHVICGSENGTVFVWNTKIDADTSGRFRLFSRKTNRNTSSETFSNTNNSEIATTVAIFAPSVSVIKLVNILCDDDNCEKCQSPIRSKLTNDESDINGDLSCRIILTADYEGIVRVYFRMS